MSAPGAADVVAEERGVVLRPPLRAYVAGSLVGVGGALLPYVAPGVVVPWEAQRATVAAFAIGALAAHAGLHVASAPGESPWPRFAAARLVPAVAVAVAALVVFAAVPQLRAAAYAAFVANAAASTLDVWEAAVLARRRPARVRSAPGGGVELVG